MTKVGTNKSSTQLLLYRLTMAVALCVSVVVSFGRAHAAENLASDTMGPQWSSGKSAGTGHQFDCTYTNSQWSSNGCTVNITTVTGGSNCNYEVIADPSQDVTGSHLYTNTPCFIELNGSANFALDSKTGLCDYTPHLTVTWASGVRSEVFSGSDFPVTTHMAGGAKGLYRLTVASAPGPAISGQHQATMAEQFNVQFPSSLCPKSAQGGFKGNVRDKVPDSAPNAPSTGYFEDSIVLA